MYKSSFVLLVGLMMFAVACRPAVQPKKADSEHNHDHDHGHSHGAHHEAHELHLKPGGEHVSWSHDEEAETVTITMEELISSGVKVDKVQIALEVDKDKKSYDLVAEKVDAKKIEGSVYSLKSPDLVTALEVPGVKAKLIIKAGDKEFTADLEHSDEEHNH
jgi:ABC-type nickel/cobalt efflux system permease component RcnA